MQKNFKKTYWEKRIYIRWTNHRITYTWRKKLISILQRIVDNGDTVIVIEHNLDMIKVADYIIDLGPEGGDFGGQIIAKGTPEEVAKIKIVYRNIFKERIRKIETNHICFYFSYNIKKK